MISFLSIVLAALGLGLLVFIHELGHYFVARKVGMTVEAFSIGFGKPIYSWERKGVKWRIGWLPFGGYVKIAGMEKDGNREPHEISDGFFGKKPFDRIKVALAGPLVNIAFAFVVFAVIWAAGGREKSFNQLTHRIGWIDPKSELYAFGVRPGDEIVEYDGYLLKGSKDHFYAAMLGGEIVKVKGFHVNYETGEKTPFEYGVKTYPHPGAIDKDLLTTGVLSSASYLIYDRFPGGIENPLPKESPMKESGIKYGDRIVSVDGELIFSIPQQKYLINEGRALVTVERNGKSFLARVPRVKINDLALPFREKEELMDWQYAAALKGKFQELFFIPYNLSFEGVVENRFGFIDPEAEGHFFPAIPLSPAEASLQPGDKILAVDGSPVSKGAQVLTQLQQRRLNIIVEQDPSLIQSIPSQNADARFDESADWKTIQTLKEAIGSSSKAVASGNLRLLKPVAPKTIRELASFGSQKGFSTKEFEKQKKRIAEIENPRKRAEASQAFEEEQNQLLLDIMLQDREVIYNPSPFVLFGDACEETWRTLTALLAGYLNPKWMSGPVGIVQVMQYGWMVGVKEALFWMGFISLNLGLLNLMPIPVLDGGYIVMAIYEKITRKPIGAKTMERLIVPFVVLLIGFFIFVTYQDISRIFRGMF